MPSKYDIAILNSQLRRYPSRELVNLAIKDGVIQEISPSEKFQAATEIDAEGNMVTESFCNPHLHLDKVYTLGRMDSLAMQDYHGDNMGKAMNAIELAARVKHEYEEGWILENVRRALWLAVKYGNTHIRAFADVDSKAKLVGVKALLKAKNEFSDMLEIQIVAFPQDGVIREPGTEELIREAMDLGADIVGGIPWIEYTDTDAQAHIDKMFDIAQEFNKPVSMLVDDAGDAGLKTLEMLAVRTINQNWHGKTLAHHARAMHLYPKPYLQKIISLLKKAKMYVVTDPHTGPLHARVKEILQEDGLICLGQDDISDAYYPFGRNNMLEVAFLASHMLWMTTNEEIETLYDMVTTEPAKAMGIENFSIEKGSPANLVVLNKPDTIEAIRSHEAPKNVIFNGN
ncbi:MAG: amidohydrolase family protein, partial [Chloroflexota bacterium]